MDLSTLAMPKVKDGQDLSGIIGVAIPIGGIVISILIAVLIIWPKVTEILELRTNNEQLRSTVQTLEQKAEILAGLDQIKLEDQLAAAEQLLPSDSNAFSVLRQVEDTANTSGVLLSKIEVITGSFGEGGASAGASASGASPELNLAPAVEIRLSLTSDYQSLLGFISGLYSFSRVASIDSLSVSAGGGDEGLLSTSFAVNAHWKQLPQNLGSIEAPVENLTSSEEELLANVKSPQRTESAPVPPVATGRGNPFNPY
ncbi:MAG: hypothetical protein UR98_C0003G0049 [Parcubacteria group bacterium GW2011_GWA1_36_12]|nr:MAG: hypothetical protein UR98_C0003G0049 [Parcubacteria group bacterium GW2011_GWA1_36_12]